MAMFRILGDVTHGRSNPLSAFWARQRPRESLQYAMQQVGNALSVPAAHMGRGPGELFTLANRLWQVSPVARSVRARLMSVAEAVRYSISMAGRGDLAASDLVCEIPFTELCETCGVLAVPLGTLIMAPTQAVAYYTGDNETDPSFGHGYDAYVHLRELLDDKSIPAEIGDSPDNPIRWPWYDREQVRILGDTTPNKGQLSNLTTIFWSLVDELFAVQTAASVASATVHRTVQIMDGSVNFMVNFYRALWDSRSTKQAVSKTLHVGATALGSSITELISFLTSWLRACRYREEINGSQKQFSIAEGLGILFLAVLVAALVVNLIIPGNAMTIFMAAFGMVSVSTLLGLPLVISYLYTPSCLPAIPYQARDDVTWALTRTVLPACDWFWSGIITNDTYDNVQCRQCENYDDDTGYVAAACFDPSTVEGGVGFQHFGKNVGFTLLQTFPDIVDSWNRTNLPVLSTLFQSQIVQSFFTGFEAYNASDPISFSVHWSCNMVHSAVPNYYIILPIFQIIALAMPLAMVGLTLMYGAIPVAYWMVMLGDASQVATLDLARVAGQATREPKQRLPMATELWYMTRLLGRSARQGWTNLVDRHRGIYYRH